MRRVYNEEQRKQMLDQIRGKVIKDCYYVDEGPQMPDGTGGYYVLEFDGNEGRTFETSIRFMAEIFEMDG